METERKSNTFSLFFLHISDKEKKLKARETRWIHREKETENTFSQKYTRKCNHKTPTKKHKKYHHHPLKGKE